MKEEHLLPLSDIEELINYIALNGYIIIILGGIEMLSTVFYFVLNMSINASLIIFFILLLRNLRGIKRMYIYMLWAVPFLRLLMPFSVSSGFSLFNYTGGLIKQIVSLGGISDSAAAQMNITMLNSIGAAESYFPISYKTDFLHNFFVSVSYIWLSGVIVALGITLLLYITASRNLSDAIKFKDNIYVSDKLSSPVIVGIIKSKIIVPTTFELQSRSALHVLRHEKVHEKRMDNLWRLLSIVIICIHWFNPLAWIMLNCFFLDIELSCDELAVKNYSPGDRKDYAHTLINYSEKKRSFTSAAFGKADVRHRIVNVLNYKKISAFGMSISILFLFILAVIFMTNPSA